MYRIPLTNSPNQTFTCIVPVNDKNVNLRFRLWYNYAAKYWLFSLYDVKTEKEIISNLPLLVSTGKFSHILVPLDYMKIGIMVVAPLEPDLLESPDDENLGSNYALVWGDNDVD